MKFTTFLFAALLPASAMAAPLELKPANPQPGSLKAGLGVSYVNSVPAANQKPLRRHSQLKNKKPGKPLSALNFDDRPQQACDDKRRHRKRCG